MLLLEPKECRILVEIELTTLETSLIGMYASCRYVKDEEVLAKCGINSVKSLSTTICRIKAKTGLVFERKSGYGYRLCNVVLING